MNTEFFYKTPIGQVCLRSNERAIIGLDFFDSKTVCRAKFEQMTKTDFDNTFQLKETELIKQTHFELEEYLLGKRKTFSVPVFQDGTTFQKEVWNVLQQIPYGKTLTYGEVAKLIGKPKAARAVGGACHANNVLILIPCHRVIGSNGSLTGFGSGLELKDYLLKLEKNF